MPSPRLLVADDNAGMLQRICTLVAKEFEIIAAVDNGRAAVDVATTLEPDVVLLDISMPGMTGLEAARIISALPRPPLIVFLSVHEDPHVVDAARRAGATGYVLKRDIGRDLTRTIRLALDGHSAFPTEPPRTAHRIRT